MVRHRDQPGIRTVDDGQVDSGPVPHKGHYPPANTRLLTTRHAVRFSLPGCFSIRSGLQGLPAVRADGARHHI